MQRQLAQQTVGRPASAFPSPLIDVVSFISLSLFTSWIFETLFNRWIISAAHCFCALNEHVECTLVNRGFDKKLAEVDETYGKNFNERWFSHRTY